MTLVACPPLCTLAVPVDDSQSPAQLRLEARTAGRARYWRGQGGVLAAAGERLEGRQGGRVQMARARHREETYAESREEIRGVDEHFRRIRYRSGPWDGDPENMLPVSWFLLWRSNVSEEPRPALLRKEPVARGTYDVREGLPERGGPERPDPRTFTTRAPARLSARDSQSLRFRPTTEE